MRIFEVVGTGTKLYHYSDKKFDVIKTRSEQHNKDKEPVSDTNKIKSKVLGFGSYDSHISFFLEKIPLDILGSIYKDVDHDVWYTGSKLYEYEVNVDDIGSFKYDLVETPLEIKMMYNKSYDKLSMEKYIELVYDKKFKLGLCGTDKNTFIKKVNELKGTAATQYKKLPSRPNWNEIQTLYAPTVPHVMLYPKGGIVKYQSVKQVEIK